MQPCFYLLHTPKSLRSRVPDGKIYYVNLVSGCLNLALCAAAGWAQSAGTFTPAGNMTAPCSYHTATLLTNGKVLIAGGGPSEPASAEIYDPTYCAGLFEGSVVPPKYRSVGISLKCGGSAMLPDIWD